MEDTDSDGTLFIGMVKKEEEPKTQINAIKADKWIPPLQINGTIITLKLDTAAKANLISMSVVKAMREKTKIQKNTLALKDYNGQSIECFGTCKLKVTIKDKVHNLLFSVVPEGLNSLLGDKACKNLELVKIVYRINTSITDSPDSANVIVQNFPDVFKGPGVLPFTYKIQLKDNAQPVIHAARRVPLALGDSLKKRSGADDSAWCDKKDRRTNRVGQFHCLCEEKEWKVEDMREHYQIPTREEITSEMAGARYIQT